VRDTQPVELEDEIVFGPRSVPAAWSCSEAMPVTGPSGDSWVPAVERIVCGSSSIASTAL
jgi:hypothetical protein